MFKLPRSGHFVPKVLAASADRGVVAIEFAVFATLFLVILAGTVDLGLMIFNVSALDAAVSAGAQYAENNAAMIASNPSTLSTNISTIIDNVNGAGWATSTINVNNSNDATSCYCPSGSVPNVTWGSTHICGAACTSGVAGQFVTITASRAVSSLFPSFGFVRNGTISRSAVVETQ